MRINGGGNYMKITTLNTNSLRINKHNSVFVILFFLSLATWIYSPEFLNPGTVLSMLRQSSALGVLTAGQLIVIISGGVDLSVVATMQMSIVICTYFVNNYGIGGLAIGVILSMLVGIVMGIVNGGIVSKYNVQPFLVTLFTALILTGLRMIFIGEDSAGAVPDAIRFIGNESTGIIPNAVIVFFIVVVFCWWLLNKSVFGRQLICVGSNKAAAVFAGINVDMTIIKSYCFSGLMAVLASILLAGYTGYADMWIGEGFEFNSLAAAVIGGNFLGGGRGSILGVVGGVLVITFQYIFTGLIFIAATLMGAFSARKK
jgi:ribose/xylose/arabinose/galactoside ABC-type transport system permease subunit